MTKIRHFIRYLVAIALFASVPHTPGYAIAVSDEDRVKAAFVFNFIKFVEWPEESFKNSNASLNVCVWGSEADAASMMGLHQKTAKQRTLMVVTVNGIGELGQCHVLFLTRNSRSSFKDVLRSIAHKKILSVSDIADFARNGGLIGLFKSDDQMRFAINVEATQRSGLRMSSQLLKFGKIVSGGGD